VANIPRMNGGGGLGGVLPQNIFEARKCQFLHSEHHKFAPKLMLTYPGFQSLRDISIYYLLSKALESRVMLTILVFEIKEGKNAQKV
jgi:hypothetical protein